MTSETMKVKEQYLKCKKCGWENYVDLSAEIPPQLYSCDECGKQLQDEAKELGQGNEEFSS